MVECVIPGTLADKDVEPHVTIESNAIEFDRELDRRMLILTTLEADSPVHRRLTGKQFAIFVAVTLAICAVGAGVAAL